MNINVLTSLRVLRTLRSVRTCEKGLRPLTKIEVEKITMGYEVPAEDPVPWGNNCGNCTPGQTPEKIRIKFLEMIDCDIGCIWGGAGPLDWYWLGDSFKDALNNNWYVLTQTGNPCIWSASVDGSFGKISVGEDDCSTEHAAIQYDKLDITVQKTSATEISILGVITATGHGAGFVDRFFSFSGVPNTLADCIKAKANNEDTCLTVPAQWLCAKGKAEIQEWG